MTVLQRGVAESSLPNYHRSIDWDALYKRYPVPEVFERGRWRIDDIRPGVGKDAWSLRREIITHKG